MINRLKSLSKKQMAISLGSLFLTITLVIVIYCLVNRYMKSEITYNVPEKITVTDEDIREYRERIGTDMDIKKAYLILFKNKEECLYFIENHGADENPTSVGLGTVPLMEDGYYNIVGKEILEEHFDKLQDGEYSKTPIVYSNMYCYLKRICVDSLVNNDKALKTLIQNEKYQELKKAGD